MSAEAAAGADGRAPRLGPGAFKRLVSVLAGTVFWSALLFASAGRLDWTRAWVYVIASLVCLFVNGGVMIAKNPELIARRGEVRKGTKAFDKVIMAAYTLALFALPVVAGLDAARFGWSSMPFGTLYAGVALLVLGFIPIAWAMATNPNLERTVRIQEDRGHEVTTTGPYGVVRHPMYAGMLLLCAGGPLAFGSVWAFVPAGVMALALVVRTAFEDRILRSELPGYAEYAQRVRSRLLPGVW